MSGLCVIVLTVVLTHDYKLLVHAQSYSKMLQYQYLNTCRNLVVTVVSYNKLLKAVESNVEMQTVVGYNLYWRICS